jgi:hypothetical protein
MLRAGSTVDFHAGLAAYCGRTTVAYFSLLTYSRSRVYTACLEACRMYPLVPWDCLTVKPARQNLPTNHLLVLLLMYLPVFYFGVLNLIHLVQLIQRSLVSAVNSRRGLPPPLLVQVSVNSVRRLLTRSRPGTSDYIPPRASTPDPPIGA